MRSRVKGAVYRERLRVLNVTLAKVKQKVDALNTSVRHVEAARTRFILQGADAMASATNAGR